MWRICWLGMEIAWWWCEWKKKQRNVDDMNGIDIVEMTVMEVIEYDAYDNNIYFIIFHFLL